MSHTQPAAQSSASTAPPGVITLAATPIGNVADASQRLRDLLATAEVIAAEDTRRLRALADRLGVKITARLVSHHEHNEHARAAELLAAARQGQSVLVVSDAGMPAVSDPGYRLVAAAAAAQVPVTVAPGPSAALTALALSGLPTDRFTFEGFLPRRAAERAKVLAALADEPRTMVFFEATHRIAESLPALAAAFGAERPAAVCRELTKTFEEVLRGPLSELAELARARAADGSGLKGEIAIVVAGAPRAAAVCLDELVAATLSRAQAGERMKDVAAELAASASVSKRDLYNAALAARAD
ncbi:MAG: 16S rRNA (cytidine(1402)-2'-O)-methyltransferase [Promicromonosporaceae bacterium]|nr:16S rRNA (cytidine(1402)-2'-O)-methyltransferase [Promicromonosporaceae bacterium]